MNTWTGPSALRNSTMEQYRLPRGPSSLCGLLLGLFAVPALSLAALGLYATVSLLVAERSREIGIRMALGAARRSVLGLVFQEGLILTASGLTVGLTGASICRARSRRSSTESIDWMRRRSSRYRQFSSLWRWRRVSIPRVVRHRSTGGDAAAGLAERRASHARRRASPRHFPPRLAACHRRTHTRARRGSSLPRWARRACAPRNQAAAGRRADNPGAAGPTRP